ncbi:MAG: hypothetical protein DIU60_013075, partial [Actinomycetes bacterium]
PTATRARRLGGMLARKGYSPGLVYRVVREALEAEGEADGHVGDDLDALAGWEPEELSGDDSP